MGTNGEPDEQPMNWEQLVEAIATGELAIFDVIKGVSPQLYTDGDCEGFVMWSRAMLMLMRDPRILKRLHAEAGQELEKATGNKPDLKEFQRVINSKDGPRRIQKLGAIQAEMYGDGPTLITGSTFDECLRQYTDLIAHVERLWDDACRLYREKHFPISTFISILAIEETGKLGRLWFDLLAWDRPLPAERQELGLLGRDHRKKHFLAVAAGAVVNARLDRILSVKNIRQLLQDVESGKLEQLRQSCLYVDVSDGKVVTPDKVIDHDTAKFFAVLAGELWAETLGHFPWDFKRMISKVAEFEIELGFNKSDVERA